MPWYDPVSNFVLARNLVTGLGIETQVETYGLEARVLENMLSLVFWFRHALGALFLVTAISGAAGAESSLDSFFPSDPITEDDRLSGSFQLSFEGCSIILLESTETFTMTSRFDVSSYQTLPFLLKWRSPDRLSSRKIVTWPVIPDRQDGPIDELNEWLGSLRLSLRDRAQLSKDEIEEKSRELRDVLVEIQNGDYGEFAQMNHELRYTRLDEPLLISVWINTEMYLPVSPDKMSELARAMFRYAAECG